MDFALAICSVGSTGPETDCTYWSNCCFASFCAAIDLSVMPLCSITR